jgi:hypothetical protein
VSGGDGARPDDRHSYRRNHVVRLDRARRRHRDGRRRRHFGSKAAPCPGGRPGSPIKPQRRTKIRPYLEVDQDLLAELTPYDDVVTYTTLAAGADVSFGGRRTEGAASIRYEHRFFEAGAHGGSDAVSGLARVRREILPRTLYFEVGGLAARTGFTPTGGTLLNTLANNGSTGQIWSVYGGPALTTHAGVVHAWVQRRLYRDRVAAFLCPGKRRRRA